MRLNTLLGLTTLALVLAAVPACDDDTTNGNTSSSGDGGTSSGNGGDAGGGNTGGSGAGNVGGGGGNPCAAPEPPNPGVSTTPGAVTGRFRDLTNANASMVMADVCGTNLCIAGESETNGTFSIDPAGANLTDVHFIHGNGKRFAKMTADLPSPTGGDFGDITLIDLPAVTSGTDIAAGMDVMDSGVTLSVGADAEVDVDAILYPTDERGFRANVVAVAAGTFPAVDASLNLDFLVATAPINTTFCPAATLTFPNQAGYADGAEVEIFIHGTLTFNHWATYGGWALVSEGVVDSGGATITTKDGEGVPILGVFGVRAK